ncbi:Transketolase [Fusarium falciforme]|nr:Transketolase [Fusarium falciforme]
MTFKDDDERAIKAIRLLAADATFNSKSGHPGAPMNGHACILQYIMLHLRGYEIIMDDLKTFDNLVALLLVTLKTSKLQVLK